MLRAILLSLILLLSSVTSLHAADGVLEINQACAGAGCFSGDAAGLPVTIDGTAGRSYRLTSDLVVPDPNTHGVFITTHDVGIDLNNFTIIGAACVGATTVGCRPTVGTGSGVEVDDITSRFGISVRNGSITGMGRTGLLLGPQAEVRDLRVRWNREVGIVVGPGSTVSGSTAYRNGFQGIVVNPGSTASGNTAYQNGLAGIAASEGSTISGNTAYQNGGDGIFAFTDCLVQRNTVRLNSGFGLNLFTATAYRENVINDNTGGTVSLNGGVDLGANSCNGGTTCT